MCPVVTWLRTLPGDVTEPQTIGDIDSTDSSSSILGDVVNSDSG